MRICPSCGRENADNRDFCDCGEYLRWEPTQHLSAVKAPAAAPAVDGQDVGASTGAGTAAGSIGAPAAEPAIDPDVTLAPAAVVVPQAGAPAMPSAGTAAGDGPPPGAATLLLRLPDSEEPGTSPIVIGVKPGERATLLGLIRNESGIVDNYDLSVSGLPDGWWTIAPATAYLVPYGTSGTYEQEVQIYLHPPRSPDAQARPWPFEVVAKSRAYQTQVAQAPASVEIGPYQDIGGKIAPDRASGRLKARFVLTVRNRANAPTEVTLNAEDADGECEFRFAQPSITVDAGRGIEAPFTVFPEKQIWIGRPKDRSIRVSAIPAGAEQPPPPIPAVYRQRSWLPWWLSVVAPVAAALIALFILLSPKQTVVPNLKVAKSVFAAEKLLMVAGLKLSPQVGQATVAGAIPGSIVGQTPAAGKKVKRGTSVSIEVAVAASTVKVPSVVGLTPVTADTTLRASGLVLGAVSPAPNPNGKIGSQIPAPQLSVAAGTPVAVFLQPPAAASKAAASGSSTTGAAGANGGKSGSGAVKPVVIPAVSGAVMAAAQKLSHAGLDPTSIQEFNPAPVGTLLGTRPAAGKSLAPGTKIALIVSAGFPHLAYDDGNTIHIVDGDSGKAAGAVPASPQEVEPSWSIDGSHIVYVQGGGQLMLFAPAQKGAQPFALTAAGANDHAPSLAPTTKSKIVAFISGGGQNKLCFATIGPNLINPDCTSHPGWSLGRQVAWSPNGSAILVFGSEVGHPDVFGLIEFLSNVPFSTHASDWGQGTVVTATATPGQGVIAGAFSPNGKQLAVVANFGTLDFHLLLTKAHDFGLAHAQVLPVRACQLSWRSDGNELAVMQADSACTAPTGDIVAVDPATPNTFRSIATQAEYPAWQPLSLSG